MDVLDVGGGAVEHIVCGVFSFRLLLPIGLNVSPPLPGQVVRFGFTIGYMPRASHVSA